MISSNLQMILIATGVIVGVVGSVGIGFPLLKKKGINAPVILSEVETGLEEAGTVIKAGQELAPNNALNILCIVDDLAIRATKAAQQLAISSQLPLEQRQLQAKTSIMAGLKTFKIPVTPELETIVDDAIEKFVFDSKTPEEQKAQGQNTLQQQNTSLQATITQLATDKTALQQQVTDLSNKLNTVQATVTPVITTASAIANTVPTQIV
jgi:hypothetical protein